MSDDDLPVPVALLAACAVLGALFIGIAIAICCYFCVPRGHRCRRYCDQRLKNGSRTAPIQDERILALSPSPSEYQRAHMLVEPYIITFDQPPLLKTADCCYCCYCPPQQSTPPPSPIRQATPPPQQRQAPVPAPIVAAVPPPPTDLLFTRHLTDKTLTQFPEKVVLECELNRPDVPVVWTKNGFPVDKRRAKTEMNGRTHRLILERADPSDEGSYECASSQISNNNSKAISTTSRLSIKTKPTLQLEKYVNKTMEIKAGQTVYFHVPFTGYPRPRFSVQFKNSALPDPLRMTISDVGRDQTIIFTITDALRSDTGTYTVVAENESGRVVGDLKLEVKDRPSVPRDFAANEVVANACKISWLAPNDDGGAPLESYHVERKEVGKDDKWHPVGRFSPEITQANYLDLKANSQYVYRVAAINKWGTSDWATLGLTARQGIDIPGKPEPPNVGDITKARCRLNWSAPMTDGGSPITKYLVEFAEAGTNRWLPLPRQPASTLAPLTMPVSNLSETVKYQFRVAAENKAGLGPYSDPSQPISPKDQFTVPAKPNRPVVNDVSKSRCRVAWEPPPSDGGAPITSYLIERAKLGTNKWEPLPRQSVSTTLAAPINNLDDDVLYQFRVAAENKAGRGPYSDPSDPVLAKDPWEPPGPPDPPKVSDIAKKRCRVNWQPPLYDGGAPISDYVVERRKVGSDIWQPVPPPRATSSLNQAVPLAIPVNNLDENDKYQFRVAAENKAGLGPFSEPSEPVTIADQTTVPGRPSKPLIDKVTDNSCHVSWLPPGEDGGTPVEDYIIEAVPADPESRVIEVPVAKPEKLNQVVRNLKPNETYEFQVSAVNRIGRGDPSDPSGPVTTKSLAPSPPLPAPPVEPIPEEPESTDEKPLKPPPKQKKKPAPKKKKVIIVAKKPPKPAPQKRKPAPPPPEKPKQAPAKKPPPPPPPLPPPPQDKSKPVKPAPPPPPPPPPKPKPVPPPPPPPKPKPKPVPPPPPPPKPKPVPPPPPPPKPKPVPPPPPPTKPKPAPPPVVAPIAPPKRAKIEKPPPSKPSPPKPATPQVEQVDAGLCGCGGGGAEAPPPSTKPQQKQQLTPRKGPPAGDGGPSKRVTFNNNNNNNDGQRRRTPTKRTKDSPRDSRTPPLKKQRPDSLDRLLDDKPEFTLYFGSMATNALKRTDITRKVTEF